MQDNKEKQYNVIKFLSSHNYDAYQFLSTIQMKEENAENCFKYVYLIIQRWIDEKLLCESQFSKEQYKEISINDIKGFTRSEYSQEIESIIDHETYEWALKIREPDSDTGKGNVVNGRFFITNIALKKCDEKQIELAIKISVIDPDGAVEIENAYRPRLVRDIISDDKLDVKVDKIPISKEIIQSHYYSNNLDKILSSKRFQMPLVCFTETNKNQIISNIANSMLNDLSINRKLIFDDEISFENNMTKAKEKVETFAEHNFGFACTIFIDEDNFNNWKKVSGIKDEIGYVAIFYPKKFDIKTKIIKYNGEITESLYNKVQKDVRGFTKHKNYYYADIQFFDTLKLTIEDKKLTKIINENINLTKKDVGILVQRNKELEIQNADLLKQNNKLEFDKNLEFERAKNAYQFDYEKLNDLLLEKEEKIEEMQKKINKYEIILESLKKSENNDDGLLFNFGTQKEWYKDEKHDLIINMVQYAKKTYCDEKTRSEELVDDFLENNKITGAGLILFDDMKKVFFGNERMNDSVKSNLEELGFKVMEQKNSDGHYNIKFKDRKRYTFELASTPGDRIRGMKIAYSKINRRLSIYKNSKNED